MESNILYFYSLFFAILTSAFGVIFAPRMFLASISLFFLVCFSSLLYLGLNAKYMAVFQLILCGFFLSVYIFLFLKKIGRLNLNLKLVQPVKIIFSSIAVMFFGVLTFIFFNQEFSNSLYSIFNYINEKSSDIVRFSQHAYPLGLVLILVLVSAAVMRIFLENSVTRSVSTESREDK